MLARMQLDPTRQLVGAQCSGTLLLSKLGLLGDLPACTDLTDEAVGHRGGGQGSRSTLLCGGQSCDCGGCLASQYLAAWILLRIGTLEDAKAALHYVAPVGQKEEYVARAIESVSPYVLNKPSNLAA